MRQEKAQGAKKFHVQRFVKNIAMVSTPVRHIAKAFEPFQFFSCEEGNGVGVCSFPLFSLARCGTREWCTRGAISRMFPCLPWISRWRNGVAVTSRPTCSFSLSGVCSSSIPA